MARFSCKLSLDIPEGASRQEVAAYILDATASWKGSLRPPGGYSDLDPGDPMFELDYKSIRIVFRDDHTIIDYTAE